MSVYSLAPFYGTGKLSPSMGWTRLLAHGVPVFNENWVTTGPEALLKEVKAMPPGLKKSPLCHATKVAKTH